MNQISNVGLEFANDLVHLWTATFNQAYADVHGRENIQAYCSENFTLDQAKAALSDDGTVCSVYFRDGKPTGFCLLKHDACPLFLEGGSSEIKQIYVLANEYGSGAGQSLLRHACDVVHSAGHRWIWLSVSDLNYRAQSFYKKNGFVPIGSGPIFEVGSERLKSTIMSRYVKVETGSVS